MSWFAGYELFFYLTEDITFFKAFFSLCIAHILQTALPFGGFPACPLVAGPFICQGVRACLLSQGGRSETLKGSSGYVGEAQRLSASL